MAVAMDDETHRDQHLVRLPAEMVEHILMWLDPASLLTAAGVCRMLHSLIRGNKRLFHDVYLLHLVNMAPPSTHPDLRGCYIRYLSNREAAFSHPS